MLIKPDLRRFLTHVGHFANHRDSQRRFAPTLPRFTGIGAPLHRNTHLIRESQLTGASDLLQTIPGIQETAAATMLAESGPDMKQFPKPENFSSWSGVAPGNNESAGIKKRAPAMKGNPHIKVALVESGWAASRTKGSEFRERYERFKTRIGHKRALVAAAHLLALKIYQVLESGKPYQPPSAEFKPREVRRLRHHHARRLKTLDRWLTDQSRQS